MDSDSDSPENENSESAANLARSKLESEREWMAGRDFAIPVVVKPSQKHTATVVMLHGLGGTGADWEVRVHRTYMCTYIHGMEICVHGHRIYAMHPNELCTCFCVQTRVLAAARNLPPHAYLLVHINAPRLSLYA